MLTDRQKDVWIWGGWQPFYNAEDEGSLASLDPQVGAQGDEEGADLGGTGKGVVAHPVPPPAQDAPGDLLLQPEQVPMPLRLLGEADRDPHLEAQAIVAARDDLRIDAAVPVQKTCDIG